MPLVINGEKVEDTGIEEEMQKLRPYYEQYVKGRNPDAGDKQLREWSKENVVERILIKQAAQKDPEKVPEDKIQKAFEEISKRNPQEANQDTLKLNIEVHLKVELLINKITKDVIKPGEKESEKFYEEHKERFILPEQVHAAHIEKHVTPEVNKIAAFNAIQKVKEALDNGATFEVLAERHTDCPSGGWDLGYFHRGQMVQEFEDVVFALQPNQVSDIFQTDFGFHIAKAYDHKLPTLQSFEEIKNQIADELYKEKQNHAIEEYVDRLKQEATIEDSEEQ